MDCSTPGFLSFTISWSLLKLRSIQLVMPSNHLILCHPLLLLPSVFPSIRVFSNESVLPIRWPKDWSFSFNISPFNELRNDFFRIDWFDLLAVQGTLNNLLQYHSSKASIIWCSAFFNWVGQIVCWRFSATSYGKPSKELFESLGQQGDQTNQF